MGLTRDGVAFLLAAKRLGVNLDSTLMLGRQSLLADHARVRAAFTDNADSLDAGRARELVDAGEGYSEPLLRHLGARHIDSMDVASYENSTILHDLNQPLPEGLHGRFSLVIDGGTLEHVYDFPAALANALQAVKVGGHFIAISPTNGYPGHGFYQLSPELFYRALAPVNGFRVVVMLLKPLHWQSRWRQVPDPVETGGRVMWRGSWPTLLYALAERTEAAPIGREPVMQSDYLDTWQASTPAAGRQTQMRTSAIRSAMPLAVKEIRESLSIWRTSRSDLPAMKLSDLA